MADMASSQERTPKTDAKLGRDVTRIAFELVGDTALAVEVAAEMVPALRGRGFIVRAATAGEVDVLALAP